jgi:hypothetical protein
MSGNMSVELGSMEEFQKRIQTVLDTLKSSTVAPGKVTTQHKIKDGAEGEFAEAHLLSMSNTMTLESLERLSTQLKMQIEAMRMSTDYARGAYEAQEGDIAARYAKLQATDDDKYFHDKENNVGG